MTEQARAFWAFVRPYEQRLHAVARRYLVRVEDAHDLVQETLLRAFRNFSPGEERTYRRAWLFVIMRNVAFEWQRTATRRSRLLPASDRELTELAATDNGDPLASLPAMDERAFCEFLDDRVLAALDALEPRFREVIILSVAGDLRYKEIAQVLDCPLGTVMSRMGRARRSLREQLAGFAGSHVQAQRVAS